MCWFTLSPAKNKKQHQRHHSSSGSSCAEDIVRVHRSPSPRRFSDVRVKLPSDLTVDMTEHHHHPELHAHLHPHLHHHHRHHLHPLHLHPVHDHFRERPTERLHGSGKKRGPPPPNPPPSRNPSRPRSPPSNSGSRSSSESPSSPCGPIYRTQVVEPMRLRETTHVALRSVQAERPRGRLRRVAGYEVLGREVPWTWDCVSSTTGSNTTGKWVRKRPGGGSGGKYPPFGSLDRWL